MVGPLSKLASHGAQSHHTPRTYRGHRRASWVLEDPDALIELRARSRTFDGAYTRTALGNLYYSLIVLKVFSSEFARIGLIYVIMSCLLLLIAQFRRRRSDHDFSDKYRTEDPIALPGVKASERLWGTRPFRTSGDIIILLGVVCAALYIAIFVMIMRL
ncbi:hypothetical protein JCM8115_004276 [Rhodotorula mucilaginosa]|uniref:DUF202 domain-containing protein n=1 Tax=Rhodotorula mucilaginosa TaxID=5537 RepID=A0A9P7B5X5_RHOMI|nr:hypothetical protein C6P46_003895 [Rhodotorula mucilaginosa]